MESIGPSTLRARAPEVTPARIKSFPLKQVRLHSRKERIMATVFPLRMAPSARTMRRSS